MNKYIVKINGPDGNDLIWKITAYNEEDARLRTIWEAEEWRRWSKFDYSIEDIRLYKGR